MNVVVAQSCHNVYRVVLAVHTRRRGEVAKKTLSSVRPSSEEDTLLPDGKVGEDTLVKEVFWRKGGTRRDCLVRGTVDGDGRRGNGRGTENEEEIEEEQGCAIAIVGTGACPHCKRANRL